MQKKGISVRTHPPKVDKMLTLNELLNYLYGDTAAVPQVLRDYASVPKNSVANITLDVCLNQNLSVFAPHDDMFLFLFTGEVGSISSYSASVCWDGITIACFSEAYGPKGKQLAEWAVKTAIKNYILENSSFFNERIIIDNLKKRFTEDIALSLDGNGQCGGCTLTQIIKTRSRIAFLNAGHNTVAARDQDQALDLSEAIRSKNNFYCERLRDGEVIFCNDSDKRDYNASGYNMTSLSGINVKTQVNDIRHTVIPLSQVRGSFVVFVGTNDCADHFDISKLLGYLSSCEGDNDHHLFSRKLNQYLKKTNLRELSFFICFFAGNDNNLNPKKKLHSK